MRNKKDLNNKTKDKSAAEYYDLKTEAVEDLASAAPENTPQYSEEELKRYRSKEGIHLSDGVKIFLIKLWFAGAVCFFFLWGLGTYLSSQLDQMFITAVVLGIVTDVLENSILRFMEKTPGENRRWMMVSGKGFFSMVLNIAYAFVLMLCIYGTYYVINSIAAKVQGDPSMIFLGVEPVFFGIFRAVFDLLLVGLKNLVLKLFRKD